MKISELSDSQLGERIRKNEEIEKLVRPFLNYKGVDEVVSAKIIKEHVEVETEQKKLYTSMNKLNSTIDGFKLGDLVTVSGISGNGKTELLISMTKDFIDRKYEVFWVSYEVSSKDFMSRFGEYEPQFYLPKQNVPNSVDWLLKRIYEAKAKYNIEVVIIDHLHYLLDMQTLRHQNISHIFGGIIRRIKSTCLMLDITCFLVAHLNKTQTKDVPDLVDFRDSSFTYQEADTVLIIHREINNAEIDLNQTKFNALLRIAKNRWNAHVGIIKLTYDKQKRRYYSD